MQIKELVIATHNNDKKTEMQYALKDLEVKILSLDSFPEIGEIEESGSTLLENSFIKAKEVYRKTGIPTLADDTGLEVEFLNGAPGIYSARYAGKNVTYEDNVKKLLSELSGVEKKLRAAQFRTVISFFSAKKELWVDGRIEGFITEKPIGEKGFGYDSVFFVPDRDLTFAQMGREEKNKISHRGLALKKIVKLLKENIY
ncbi:RdgB/HAM1 family non-canonical purine NTP pyrophosphatase [bacterium]|nr:RdgB/HAM1 family non-canonical purine NTP pyrophosphatase [bacterium]